MKFHKWMKIRVSAVLVFTLTVAGVAAYAGNMPKEAPKTADMTQSNLTAGVVSALDVASEVPLDVTAGVSDILTDMRTVAVDDMDLATVGQGIETDSQDGEASSEEEGIICGYENLGIADIKEGNLNVREEETTDSKVVGKMTKHNACEVLEQDGDWLKIKSGKVQGYVKAEYILTGDEALAIAEEEIVTVVTVTGTATLRVREKPSTDSATLALVGEGESLVVKKEKNDWYYVEVDDQEGYVSGDYVEVSTKLPTAQTITEVKYGEGVSDVRVALVQYALQFVGNRYVWGGTSLTNGVDCSGFTMQVYAHFGISLPHHSGSQPGYGTRISASQARPGDLFFYGNGSRINHVAIYIGNGQIVHASNPRTGIKVSNAYYRTPVCVVSYLP